MVEQYYVRGDSPNCKVRNSYFDNNYVTDKNSGRGGSIEWMGENGYIVNSTFDNSYAAIGGTLLIGNNNITILKSNFSYSVALRLGGAIGGHHASNATIDGCIFNHTVAAGFVDSSLNYYGEGGAIYWHDADNVTITNSKFLDIEAHSNGGAISFIDVNNSEISNSTFAGEITLKYGGSISWVNSTNITIDSSNFTATAAARGGGAICLFNVDNATVMNSNFNNTSSPWGNGGGMLINGNADVINCSFTDFDALNDNAGGIFFYAGNSTLSNSSFDGIYSVWVNTTAKVVITANNMTSDVPNRDLTYLGEEDYDVITNPVPYSIWNDGEIYLKDNNFENIIFNNGTITSPTTMYVLDNETWEVEWNTTFVFWGSIFDDNNNTIISVDTFDTYNNITWDVGNTYFMPYNRNNLLAAYQGSFQIFGRDEGLTDCTVKPGILKVKMPTYLEINTTDITHETITFTAIITTKNSELSNFSVEGEKVHFVIHDVQNKVDDIICDAPIICSGDGWYMVKASINQTHLHVGTYTVTADYYGDNCHFASNATMLLVLEGHPIEIVIEAADIYYRQTLVLTVTSNATHTENGYIIIRINGKEIKREIKLDWDYGNATVMIPYDEYKDIITRPGNYTASVEFTNGTYYDYQANFTTFEVKKLNTTIIANATTPTVYGDSEIINVTVDRNATGFIKLFVAGKEYIEEIINGKVQFNIPNLRVGTYSNITITYLGDEYYEGNSTNVTFTVTPKSEYVFDVKVNDITYGQNATIRVLVPTDAEGNVTIYVDGELKGILNITNGTAELNNVSGLAGGEHVVNVTYSGDSTYVPRDIEKTFMVNPTTDWKLNIDAVYRPYGEDSVITITSDYPITNKNMTIKIDDDVYVINLTNGTGSLTLNNLSAGSHTGFAIYAGDANYSYVSQRFAPYIPKATPDIIIDVDPIYVGEEAVINTSVSGNATGKVLVLVGSQHFEETLNATHQVQLNVSGLSKGTHNVVVTYLGDDNYELFTNFTTVDVSKYVGDVNITITGGNTHGYGDLFNITISNNTEVYVTINGEEYTFNSTTGVVNIDTTTLPIGKYIVTATIYESDKYTADRTTEIFYITYPALDIDVLDASGNSVSSIDVGNDVTVVVNTANGVKWNGTVTVRVNKANYAVVLVNGTGNFTLSDLVNDTYTFNASYVNDDVVYGNKVLYVNKIVTQLELVNDTSLVLHVGDSATVNVALKDADGNVIAYDGNITVRFGDYNYTVALVDGKGNLTISDLANGTYVVTAVFAETDKYVGSTSSSLSVLVNEIATDVTISFTPDSNVHPGDDVTFTVTLVAGTTNLNGNVTVHIGNYNYTVSVVDGTGSMVLRNVSAGTYAVSVDYAGTDKYSADSAVADDLVVSKITTQLDWLIILHLLWML